MTFLHDAKRPETRYIHFLKNVAVEWLEANHLPQIYEGIKRTKITLFTSLDFAHGKFSHMVDKRIAKR